MLVILCLYFRYLKCMYVFYVKGEVMSSSLKLFGIKFKDQMIDDFLHLPSMIMGKHSKGFSGGFFF